jgi:hypothetical protein
MREGAMAPSRVVKILRQILESLQEAHAMGVLHRDIKPSNIMLYKHVGRADQVKVLDFGIAKIVSDHNPDMTAEGSIVGTPRYIAPERLREEEVPASDLYSVGMVAWEMLTGRAVLDGKSGMHALRAQIEQPSVVLPPELSLPPALRQCMNKLMAKPLNQRHSAAEQVLLELERWDVPVYQQGAVDDASEATMEVDTSTPTPQLRSSGAHKPPTTRESLMEQLHAAPTEFEPQFDLDQTSANLDGIAELTRQDMLAKWHAARELEASASATLEAMPAAQHAAPQAHDPYRTMPMSIAQEHMLREAALPTVQRAAVPPRVITAPVIDDEVTTPQQRTAPAQRSATAEHAIPTAQGAESRFPLGLALAAAVILLALIVTAGWYFTRMP